MTDDFRMHGRPVSDEQIEAWASEAEAGYDPDELRKRGRPRMGSGVATVTTLRLDPDLAASLDERARRDGSTRSDVMRAALRAWLHAS